MDKLVLLGSMSAVIALILASSWLTSRWAYYAILGLVVVMLVAGDSHWMASGTSPFALVVFGDLVLFGVLYYFVTVQSLLRRKVTELTTREEFRQVLTEQGRFSRFAQFIYYLPWALLFGMILVASIGAYTS